MKYFFYIFLFVFSIGCNAQSKQIRKVLANSDALERVVFDTKDSARLESLFAKDLTYGHSNGKIQSREEAIQGIIHNKSVYIISNEPFPYDVTSQGDSTIVKKVFKATEKKADGSEVHLNLTITLVWIKENGSWKLIRRKATKNL